MNRLHRFLTWALGEPEKLTSGAGFVYMYRWVFWRRRWGSLYLHHFVRDDGARDMHDHPRAFTSLGLWGSYYEESAVVEPYGSGAFLLVSHKRYRAPWLRHFSAEHTHRLKIAPGRTCWTLVYAGRVTRPWGFWAQHSGDLFKWVPWREYVADRIGGRNE